MTLIKCVISHDCAVTKNWCPYIHHKLSIEVFVLLQYQCYRNGLYCAESALENVACIEFVMTFPDKIFICIKHLNPSTHGLKIKDTD